MGLLTKIILKFLKFIIPYLLFTDCVNLEVFFLFNIIIYKIICIFFRLVIHYKIPRWVKNHLSMGLVCLLNEYVYLIKVP